MASVSAPNYRSERNTGSGLRIIFNNRLKNGFSQHLTTSFRQQFT
jgi:hypothetical protein